MTGRNVKLDKLGSLHRSLRDLRQAKLTSVLFCLRGHSTATYAWNMYSLYDDI